MGMLQPVKRYSGNQADSLRLGVKFSGRLNWTDSNEGRLIGLPAAGRIRRGYSATLRRYLTIHAFNPST